MRVGFQQVVHRIRTWPVSAKRRAFVRRHLDPSILSIAEIGVLSTPMFERGTYRIKFIDYGTNDQLARDNRDDPNFAIERTVKIDYAVPTLNYGSAIPERFDLVVANHVIEHVPDTIRWLAGLRELIVPGGHLFLSIPDRRYTFDYLRRETTIADVLRAHREQLIAPDQIQIFDHLFYVRPVVLLDAWLGRMKRKLAVEKYTQEAAWAEAGRLAASRRANIHCHVYTFDSFINLFGELRPHIAFEIIDSRNVARWSNEFHVLFRAT